MYARELEYYWSNIDKDLTIYNYETCVILDPKTLEPNDAIITFCLEYLRKIGYDVDECYLRT